MSTYRITTQAQLRREFWASHPHLQRRLINGPRRPVFAPQNLQPCDTRCAFVDWLDALSKDGDISPELADRATL